MIRSQIFVLCFLLFAAVDRSGAQAVVRPDTIRLGAGTLRGTWSASNGSATYVGTWTAIPDTTRGTVKGTWTLVDAQGATVAFGGWAAAKATERWIGSWRANITGRPGEFSGAWTSSVDLEPAARFVDLFDKAAQTIVRGTWNSGGRSGTWSVRAGKH